MKYLNNKDKITRKKFSMLELEYLRLKSILRNNKLNFALRFLYVQKLSLINPSFSKVRIKNRCIHTNTAKSVYKFFHVNRITFREWLSIGLLNGVKKSSW